MKMMIRESLFSQEEFCSGIMNESNPAAKPTEKGGKNA
jgi:hypothetical protein